MSLGQNIRAWQQPFWRISPDFFRVLHVKIYSAIVYRLSLGVKVATFDSKNLTCFVERFMLFCVSFTSFNVASRTCLNVSCGWSDHWHGSGSPGKVWLAGPPKWLRKPWAPVPWMLAEDHQTLTISMKVYMGDSQNGWFKVENPIKMDD